MKLVDILARELKVWPYPATAFVSQDGDKDLAAYAIGDQCLCGTSNIWQGDSYISGSLFKVNFLADDWRSSIITFAQWQAAVDVLEAESSLKCWIGVGIPPNGTECEAFHPSRETWLPVKILDHQTGSECCACRDDQDYLWWSTKFRVIRTAEQIAADERLHEVRNACTAINHKIEPFNSNIDCSMAIRMTIEAMIDAGYRKFEIVDN